MLTTLSIWRQLGGNHRGRTAGFPAAPPTDPGVRFSRTGLFRQPRFRKRFFRSAFAIPRSEVGLVDPALHVRARFPLRAMAACQPLPLANQRFTRERPYRLRVLWADLTPWQPSASLLLLGRDSLPGSSFVCVRSSTFRVRPTSVSGFPRLWHTIRFPCADALLTRAVQKLPGSPKPVLSVA